MAITYTPAQSEAIYTNGKSILISAAAGSGKTAVLVQRIIEMICRDDGPDIDKLLVVTFTNPAAAEMKDKIYKEITLRLEQEPSNKKLKRQLLLLSNANIQTIHSFCLNIIKNNINMLDIPVQFRIGDETECQMLKLQCVNELIENCYEKNEEDFLIFSDTYGYGRDDQKMVDLILKFHSFSSSLANPKLYYENCIAQIKAVTEDFSQTVFADILLNRLKEILTDAKTNYTLALAEIENHPDLLPYFDLFSEEYRFIQKTLSEKNFLEVQLHLMQFEFLPLTKLKGIKRGIDNEFILSVRNQFKKELTGFLPALANSVENEKKDNLSVLQFIRTLVRLVNEFTTRYQEAKRKRSMIDFSDFEHFALEVLTNDDGTPNEIAKTYQEHFYEILIDEYQDTNDIQDYLFQLISKNGENLFLVGDVKQSIYGFRQAKPQIFIDKQEHYNDERHKLIMLSNNFRSRKEVVDAVNCIFSQTMTPKTGKTDYEKEALVHTAPYSIETETDYQAEILLYNKAQKNESETDADIEDFNHEAIMIAKRIYELIHQEHFQVYDLKQQSFRQADYGDIVILLRSMTDFSEKLYYTLLEYGIPVSAEFSENLFQSIELKVVIAILKAIDNPYDELSLTALLKSPIFHWSEDEIYQMRMTFPKEPFYVALKRSDNENAKQVICFLTEFREIAYTQSISLLIEQLYYRYHFKELFCVYQNPEQRIENLESFYRMAKSFDQTQISGLNGFLHYLEHTIQSKLNIPAVAQQMPKNAVRIISMHKSKGLEYPIVFVAGLGKRFNNDDLKSQVIFHENLGVGADYIDEKHRFSYHTLTKNAFGITLKNESVSEELRILYVALTRAKEKLILTATISNTEKSFSRWNHVQELGGITKNGLYQASSFAEMLMPCVLGRNEYRISEFGMNDLLEFHSPSVTEYETDDLVLEEPHHLFYQYQNVPRTQLPSKLSVTEANKLSRHDTAPSMLLLADLEQLDKRYSQNEYGTYFHKVFECLSLDDLKEGKALSDVISNAITQAGEREYSQEVSEKMKAFFNSELSKMLLKAEYVYREKSFLVRIPASKLYPVETDEPILLQGTTDCYFIIDNNIVLFDFKTDRRPDEEKIRKNYGKQIELYAYALEKIEEKPVVKKFIYTTENQNLIEF